jgi:hypothetical protein
MSGSIDLRIVGIGLIALMLAMQDQSKTNWASLSSVLAQANLQSTPCALPMQDRAAAQKAGDYTGSIGNTLYRLCR